MQNQTLDKLALEKLDWNEVKVIFRLWLEFPRSFWILAQAPARHPLEWSMVVAMVKALAED